MVMSRADRKAANRKAYEARVADETAAWESYCAGIVAQARRHPEFPDMSLFADRYRGDAPCSETHVIVNDRARSWYGSPDLKLWASQHLGDVLTRREFLARYRAELAEEATEYGDACVSTGDVRMGLEAYMDGVQGLTDRMRERVFKALDKGLSGVDVVQFVLGCTTGKRADGLLGALSAAGM